MSDKELEVTEEEVLEAEAEVEEVEAVEEDSIDEAKASHGDPSEVPDPTTKQAAPTKTKAGMIQATPLFSNSSVFAGNSNLSKLKPIPNKIPIARLLKKIAVRELFKPTKIDFFLFLKTSISVIPTK